MLTSATVLSTCPPLATGVPWSAAVANRSRRARTLWTRSAPAVRRMGVEVRDTVDAASLQRSRRLELLAQGDPRLPRPAL